MICMAFATLNSWTALAASLSVALPSSSPHDPMGIIYHGEVRRFPIITIDNEPCVLLKDIKNDFPKITSLSLNGCRIIFLSDNKGNRLKPPRIVAQPDEIFDGNEARCVTAERRANEKIDQISREIIDIGHRLTGRNDAAFRLMYGLAEFTIPVSSLFYQIQEEEQPHLALHEGYFIKKPKEFLIEYGPHLRAMITIMKAAVTAAGFVIPALVNVVPSIKIPDLLKDYEVLDKFLDALNKMDNVLDEVTQPVSSNTPQRVEGVDLRKLQTFLERADKCRTLGNLSRTTTDTGNVRWVCLLHYDKNYTTIRNEDMIRQFETTVGVYKKETATATVKSRKLSSENIKMLRDSIKNGFDIRELSLDKCELSQSDFDKLLLVIKHNSLLKVLTLNDIKVKPMFGRELSCDEIDGKLDAILADKKDLDINFLIAKRSFESLQLVEFPRPSIAESTFLKSHGTFRVSNFALVQLVRRA
ncbi:unnamed protein product [Didymodactylos carnosus]|uniref:Uncharacterized protein n=1 Tax=Didymodactylos carnosus TaxID=1234261 RepID=A0A814D6M5_9BILA|nr:unnamed protein product [Didymodactylos carnosus]CAF0961349.1 unnamed protein product [Didymodactylos carnosus]CAF3727360.1 unnamed protein product [Didymodactylos carnosus]CAF3734170.1 unnamed protein product [Didymodactylos carnosus]